MRSWDRGGLQSDLQMHMCLVGIKTNCSEGIAADMDLIVTLKYEIIDTSRGCLFLVTL